MMGPNVFPESFDTLNTDSLDPVIVLVSHHETSTLLSFPATATIFYLICSLDGDSLEGQAPVAAELLGVYI